MHHYNGARTHLSLARTRLYRELFRLSAASTSIPGGLHQSICLDLISDRDTRQHGRQGRLAGQRVRRAALAQRCICGLTVIAPEVADRTVKGGVETSMTILKLMRLRQCQPAPRTKEAILLLRYSHASAGPWPDPVPEPPICLTSAQYTRGSCPRPAPTSRTRAPKCRSTCEAQ